MGEGLVPKCLQVKEGEEEHPEIVPNSLRDTPGCTEHGRVRGFVLKCPQHMRERVDTTKREGGLELSPAWEGKGGYSWRVRGVSLNVPKAGGGTGNTGRGGLDTPVQDFGIPDRFLGSLMNFLGL